MKEVPAKNQNVNHNLLFYFLLFVWTISQPLTLLLIIPNDIRAKLYILKNYSGAILVAILVIFLIYRSLKHNILKVNKGLFLFSLLFPLYTTLSWFVNKGVLPEEIILYWLWTLSAYLLFPAFFNLDISLLKKSLITIFIANAIPVIVGVIAGIINNRVYWYLGNNRVVFTFGNPVYYSYSLQVLMVISLIFSISTAKKEVRFFFLGISFLSIALMFFAVARGPLMFSSSVLLIYFLGIRYSRLKFGLALIVMALIVAIMGNTSYDFDQINAFSSGRLNIWNQTVDFNFKRMTLPEIIFGKGRYNNNFGFPSATLDPISSDARISRNHVDNGYLDIILQFGVVGLLLFYIPIVWVIVKSVRHLFISSGKDKRYRLLALGSWIGILLQLIVAGIIPSFGNVVNIFLLVFLTPIIYKKNIVV